MFNLTGKNALVVGGRGRLGSSFCQSLVEHGAHVTSADISEILDVDDDARINQVTLDVTDITSIREIIANLLSKRKSIDIFIYSVTGKTKSSYLPYTDTSLDDWKKIISIELDGLYLLSQEVGKIMEKQANGVMVFVSSIYGIVANDHRIYEGSNLNEVYNPDGKANAQMFSPAVYNVVKAGVISLAKYLAAYWGTKGIRVNTISPGGIHHPDESESFVSKYADKVPMARKAEINEIDGALLYLVSSASSYVTGHNLVVDGGWTAW